MESNWHIIVIIILAAISIIVFLILQNQRDKKDLVKKIIDEDEVSIPKKHDTEVDSED